MKFCALMLVLAGLAGVAWAQDDDIPLEVRNMKRNDPRAAQYEPTDGPGIPPEVIAEAMAKPPEPCRDLTATPRPLPNGDDLYPEIPCKGVDYTQSYAETAAQATAQPAPKQPQNIVQPAPDVQVQGGGVRMDLNTLQMQRLGELDAMQGKAINMQYASTLGYMQGYTAGQQRRMNVPGQPRRGFGGY